MTNNPVLAIAVALAMAGSLAQPAWCQAKASKSASRALDLDAGGGGAGPDPLTPAEINVGPRVAPGVPAVQAKPAEEAHPIVALVRQRLATPPARASAGEREDHAGLAAYYAEASQPVWTGKDGLTPRATLALGEIRKADDWGLRAAAFDLPGSPDGSAAPEALAEVEIKVGLAVLKYARHARGGRVDPLSVSRLYDQKPITYDPKTLMQAIAASNAADAYLRDLHPKHPQFERLRQALLVARAARADNASPKSSGDAVQRLVVNMERWRWLPDNLGAIYVWDSVPEQTTSVYRDGKPVLTEKIVVGKTSSPTPVFSADMQFIIFHPSWGVPPGMKANELLPQLRSSGGGWFSMNPSSSSVLAAHGLQVSRGGVPINPDSINWSSVDIRSFDFTQPPGPKNVLGIVKFRFPNKHDVYMHDTPERHLFGGAVRAFSHGCMRVQNPVRLAEVLLAHDKGWASDKVAEYVRRGGEIKLSTPIPVHVTYFTAVAGEDGKVQVRADLYGLDSRLASALEGQAVRIASLEPKGTGAVASGEPPPPRTASKARRKPSKPQPSNPFAAIFGN